MHSSNIDNHLVTLVVIMIVTGAFGGFLNYLHNFDTVENEQKSGIIKYKYILLGIGAAFLIPVFLKMIASELITSKNNTDYLIFAGFCLIAAIFSRRFITTIGDKILETAKRAEKVALESKQKSETTQLELTSTKERIEDVKLAVDIKNVTARNAIKIDGKPEELLIELANSYIEKTSVPDYSERLKLKAELGRKMGEIIVRNNLPKAELLNNNPSEGMLLALAYSVQLRPDNEALIILNQIAKLATQLYTRYLVLVGYDTLARTNFINKDQIQEIYSLINTFHTKADRSLLKKIEDTVIILSLIGLERKE